MTTGDLTAARAAERELRASLAAAVTEARVAREEAARLEAQAESTGTDELRAVARRQAERADAIEAKREAMRDAVRAQQVLVASLEADADGAP